MEKFNLPINHCIFDCSVFSSGLHFYSGLVFEIVYLDQSNKEMSLSRKSSLDKNNSNENDPLFKEIPKKIITLYPESETQIIRGGRYDNLVNKFIKNPKPHRQEE
jgi:histidyl-tRNA synthetase